MPVIHQNFDGSPATVSEDEQSAGERIGLKLLLAYPGQAIDPISEIDRLDRHQNAYLRSDLNHLSVSRQARRRFAQSGEAVVLHWMRILLPPEDSSSTTNASGSAAAGTINSTNAGFVAFCRKLGTPPSRFFSPV
jgi:hypothetical protein